MKIKITEEELKRREHRAYNRGYMARRAFEERKIAGVKAAVKLLHSPSTAVKVKSS